MGDCDGWGRRSSLITDEAERHFQISKITTFFPTFYFPGVCNHGYGLGRQSRGYVNIEVVDVYACKA
jgi:hypothetical protein